MGEGRIGGKSIGEVFSLVRPEVRLQTSILNDESVRLALSVDP
jgi:hypothetical protein